MSLARRRRVLVGAAVAAVVILLVGIGGVVAFRVLTSADVNAPEALGPVGATESVPCPTFLTEGAAFKAAGDEVEGKTFSCGVVVVPENHDAPDGRTIELFYLKLHSSAKPPAAEPMVYLAGGPGSSGSYELTANPLLHDNLARIRATRDVIAYDQRGTGFSNYLLCAPFESTLGILQDRDRNPQIAATIKDLQSTESGIGYGALRANLCGVGTKALAGVDLAQYNSVASARDIPLLVRSLDYTQGYSLYGTSYGTRLAQVAMRTVPDGIRAVILDGPVGTDVPNNMQASTKHVSPYVEVIAACQADKACRTAYPRLAERFGTLLTKLERKPLVIDPPIKTWTPLTVDFPPTITAIDPAFFIALAKIDNLAVGGGFAGQIPRIITAAEQGDVGWFRASKFNAANSPAGTKPPATADPGIPTGGAALVRADQPLFQQPFDTLIQVATAAASSAGGQGPDGLWVTVALGDLAVRLKQGENQADLMEALLRLSVLPNKGTSAQALLDYARTNLSPQSVTAAQGIVARMTRNDVRATMWNIQDVAMTLGTPADTRNYSMGMQYPVNCSDELAFSSLEQAKTDLATTRYPQLKAYPLTFNEQILASCIAYPTALDRSATEAVKSGIPTLVYVGALDNETPAAWGRGVAKGLSRSTLVEWRNQGHIAAAHDPAFCAGGVAAAFLADPTAEPDLTCTRAADYRLTFVLR